MEKRPSDNLQLCLSVIAVTGWFALIAQFYLIIANRTVSVPETIIRYFTFFTILSNILVTLCATFLLLTPRSRTGHFFLRPATLTAIAVYITIVGGLVYNLILRQIWAPHGLQKVVDELLHTVIPVLFVFFWATWAPKKALQWKNIGGWLIFPACYVIIVLIRGALSGHYPYPFLDVKQLGYGQTLLNSGLLVLVFLFFSFLPVAIGKILLYYDNRRNSRSS